MTVAESSPIRHKAEPQTFPRLGLYGFNNRRRAARIRGCRNPSFAHRLAESKRRVSMTDYSIAAIPTTYRGRRYRSRLEARWAAFFDKLRWKHEYEPYDLHGWVPDFLLHGRNRTGNVLPVLCEVKPITEFDSPTAEKMLTALWAGKGEPAAQTLLLIGVAPTAIDGRTAIGWNVCVYEEKTRGKIAFFKCFWLRPKVTWLDFEDEFKQGDGLISGYSSYPNDVDCPEYRPDLYDIPEAAPLISEAIFAQWAEASNEVQWQPQETLS